ncbi:MAG: 2-oxoacid:acceptor oxidoreductase family protein [Syntrophorhabdaceae bacterium]|nr:2-oxoacid:acceptor oxidoreductase family protein [Syntrophorhabdales bacterium]MBP9560960.1 2-oxoacid:acceptor oxidoreductase family protein [Syntrophorhabdaceae bacterium]
MKEVRFHGRGGQGAVTSAELVAQAAIKGNMYAQAFPSFGPERRGAPVQAFLRVSDKPIKIRAKIYHPDNVIILDSTLLGVVNPADGLKPGGFIIINSNKSEDEVKNLFPGCNIALVDATHIAKEELGVPITNTTMLGALIKAAGIVDLDFLEEPIRERFGVVAQRNINAYKRAFEETRILRA